MANGWAVVAANIRKAAEAAARGVTESTNDVGEELVGLDRQLTPKDSGELAASWDFRTAMNTLEAFNTATNESGKPYAPYVEYGTSDTPPQPFARPALEQMRGRVPRIVGGKVTRRVASARYATPPVENITIKA